jgi:hypothetical protein
VLSCCARRSRECLRHAIDAQRRRQTSCPDIANNLPISRRNARERLAEIGSKPVSRSWHMECLPTHRRADLDGRLDGIACAKCSPSGQGGSLSVSRQRWRARREAGPSPALHCQTAPAPDRSANLERSGLRVSCFLGLGSGRSNTRVRRGGAEARLLCRRGLSARALATGVGSLSRLAGRASFGRARSLRFAFRGRSTAVGRVLRSLKASRSRRGPTVSRARERLAPVSRELVCGGGRSRGHRGRGRCREASLRSSSLRRISASSISSVRSARTASLRAPAWSYVWAGSPVGAYG